jgi:hypothetical protein
MIQQTNILIKDMVRNYGNAAAGPSTVSFYLSISATQEPDTPLTGAYGIGSRMQSPLSAGASSGLVSTTVPLVGVVPQGTYYLWVCADDPNDTGYVPGGAVNESIETNNCNRGSTVIVKDPDLTEISATGTYSSATDSVTIKDRTRNLGGAFTTPSSFSVTFYLSTDTGPALYPLGPGRYQIGSRTQAALGSGAAGLGATVTTTGLSRAGIPAGTYRVSACADDNPASLGYQSSDGAVTESNETGLSNCKVGNVVKLP